MAKIPRPIQMILANLCPNIAIISEQTFVEDSCVFVCPNFKFKQL